MAQDPVTEGSLFTTGCCRLSAMLQMTPEIRPKNGRFQPDGGKTAGSSLMDFDSTGKPPLSNFDIMSKNRFSAIPCQF